MRRVSYVCLCLSHMCVFVCLAQPGLTCPQTPPYSHEQALKQRHADEVQKLRTSHSEQQQELEKQNKEKEKEITSVHGELKKHATELEKHVSENRKLKTRVMPTLLSKEEQDEVRKERMQVKDANAKYLLPPEDINVKRPYRCFSVRVHERAKNIQLGAEREREREREREIY